MSLITKTKLASLLNRSLTPEEDTNFCLYLDIAQERIEELLCLQLNRLNESRTFKGRYGYKSLYVDPFTAITSVTVDGEAVTDYVTKQNERYNGTWYNIVEFETRQPEELVVINASWGFNSLPNDLALLLAGMFNEVSVERNTNTRIKSKKIEDYSVTYNDTTVFDTFVSDNMAIIEKYSNCHVGNVQHGEVRKYSDERIHRLYY